MLAEEVVHLLLALELLCHLMDVDPLESEGLLLLVHLYVELSSNVLLYQSLTPTQYSNNYFRQANHRTL